MPERVWSFGPLLYALPARAVADTDDIRRTLEGARGGPPLNLRTVPASPDRNVAVLTDLPRARLPGI
jgi:hypothetical protein